MKIKKLRLRLNLAIDFVYCLNLNLYTDIPRSEWVQQNKDMVSKMLKNGVILRTLFLRSQFIEILLYASKISKS